MTVYVLEGTMDPYANPEDNIFVVLGTYDSPEKVQQATDIAMELGYHDFVVTPWIVNVMPT